LHSNGKCIRDGQSDIRGRGNRVPQCNSDRELWASGGAETVIVTDQSANQVTTHLQSPGGRLDAVAAAAYHRSVIDGSSRPRVHAQTAFPHPAPLPHVLSQRMVGRIALHA
jgi:hypothetical protein